MKKITEYDFPRELKEMDTDELELLTYGIREFLVDKVSKTGGHLASNLGVVELTIGLHKVFDFPKDKIIWDVGHQSYVHKILTGRAAGFDTLRQFEGMSGFPKRKESEYDCYDTGHSSTSLSAASGMAYARDIKGENHEVIAVIGDGSLTGGMAYEALNNIGSSKSRVIVILNDNGMSISQNIGGVSQHLGRLRTSDPYLAAKSGVKGALNKIPKVGKGLARGIGEAKDWFKYAMLSGGIIFEELGFTYLGPIDGHNMKDVLEELDHAKNVKGPVIVHMKTVKGKGYRNAELAPNKFHGIGPFDPETGEPLSKSGPSFSSVFGNALTELAKEDASIVAVTAAMTDGTGLDEFARVHPDRLKDVGIAEEHAVSFAAGLALNGLKPVVAIYSSFLQRSYDQIVEDVALQNLPVVFAIDRAGVVGADGETHHGMLDIPMLSSVPGMTILTPSDGNQLRDMLAYALKLQGPCAIRFPRGTCLFNEDLEEGYAGGNVRLVAGKDLDILGVGPMAYDAIKVRDKLKSRGIDAGIVDICTVKPLETVSLDLNRNIVTMEDGSERGGFGDILRSSLSGDYNILKIGWPDLFVEHGSRDELLKKYEMDTDSIVERIIDRF